MLLLLRNLILIRHLLYLLTSRRILHGTQETIELDGCNAMGEEYNTTIDGCLIIELKGPKEYMYTLTEGH